jgi:integrase
VRFEYPLAVGIEVVDKVTEFLRGRKGFRHHTFTKIHDRASIHGSRPPVAVWTATQTAHFVGAIRSEALSPERLTRLIHTYSGQAGPPPVRLHDLRYGAASLALAAGTDLKVIQDMPGHASIALTVDTHTSVLAETAARIRNVGRIVPGTHRPRRRHYPRPPESDLPEVQTAA